MNEIVFELMKLAVMVVAMVTATRILPALRTHIRQEKMDSLREWAHTAVLYAEQVLENENKQKKDAVTGILRAIRDKEKIPLTDEEIEILIEAAVRQMKKYEGVVVAADDVMVEFADNVAITPEDK